jgi:hypothetical protein
MDVFQVLDYEMCSPHVYNNNCLVLIFILIINVIVLQLFPVEHRFYNRAELAYHKRKGDKDSKKFIRVENPSRKY